MKRYNNTDSDAADENPIKRPREEEQTEPRYGSKEYWEARYKSHLPDVDIHNVSGKRDAAVGTKTGGTGDSANDDAKYVLDGIKLSKEAINPGHAWYFTYDELRPLILPLVLGSLDSGAEEFESECDDGDSWVEEEVIDEEDADEEIEKDEEEDWIEEEVAEAVENEEEEGPKDANGNQHVAKSDMLCSKEKTPQGKPKKVLEVGCGDVPLGLELAADLVKMEGADAKLFVSEISCIDYSEIVVKSLIDKQKKEKSSTLQASFDSLDARDLPYMANTYDVVLEKGTLDAMLSDKEEGKQNCIQIVKEMARVTNIGGSILIVSHLNANEPKGMGWLEDVVFSGLKAEFSERRDATYSVEVHGGEGQINDEDEVITFGPAVYIIRKKSVAATIAREPSTMPPVKVEFLTYD